MGVIVPYEPGQVRLQPQDAPSLSGAPAQNLAQGVDAIGAAFEKITTEHDALTAQETDTNFRNQLLEKGMGEGGYYRKNGRDAVDAYEGFRKELAALQRQTLDGVKSPGARTILGTALSLQATAENERALRHYVSQQKVWNDSVTAGSIASKENFAAAHFGDDQAALESLSATRNALTEQGKREGLAPEAVEAMVQERQSKTIELMANTAAQFGSRALESVLTKYGEGLDAKTRTALESKLVELSVKDASLVAANTAFETGGSASEMYARLDTIENVQVKAAAKSALKSRIYQQKQIDAEEDKDTLQLEIEEFRTNPTYSEADIPASASPALYASMSRYIARRKQEENGEPSLPSLKRLEEIRAMSQEELTQLDINVEAPQVGKFADDVAKLIGDAKKPDPLAIGEVDRSFMNEQARSVALTLYPGKGAAAKSQRVKFSIWVEKQLRGIKNPTYEDLDAIVERGSKAYVTDPGWINYTEKYGFEIEKDAVKGVEEEEAVVIRAALNKHLGKDTRFTEETLSRVYEMHIVTGVPYDDIAESTAAARRAKGDAYEPTDSQIKASYYAKLKRGVK